MGFVTPMDAIMFRFSSVKIYHDDIPNKFFVVIIYPCPGSCLLMLLKESPRIETIMLNSSQPDDAYMRQ